VATQRSPSTSGSYPRPNPSTGVWRPPPTHPPPTPRRHPPRLEHHPAAALFPLLPVAGPEFGKLVADIGEHGVLQPIVLHEGRTLGGRNRYCAGKHAGVEP
jgi:ParB-like chromosome segregation protein Spo0J